MSLNTNTHRSVPVEPVDYPLNINGGRLSNDYATTAAITKRSNFTVCVGFARYWPKTNKQRFIKPDYQ
jgi:hypothetical protein